MLQNASKTLGFKKNMVWGRGKPYPASGLIDAKNFIAVSQIMRRTEQCELPM